MELKKNITLSKGSKIKYQNLIKSQNQYPNTQLHDRSLSCVGSDNWNIVESGIKHYNQPGTGTSIKSGGNKLVLWTQNSPLSEMTRSCKCE